MKHIILLFVVPLVLSVMFVIRSKSVVELCEMDSCPDCFGDSICHKIEQGDISLQFQTFVHFLYNLLNIKNVYYAVYEHYNVVLKKLAHDSEFMEFNKYSFESKEDFLDYLTNDIRFKKLRICDQDSAEAFLAETSFYNPTMLKYTIQINPEPILLQLFNDSGFPVPVLYGSCGRLIVVENAGYPLLTIEQNIWSERAFVAYQILQAAVNFTSNHELFRLYLTDISPDNIVVNEQLQVKFIDLENAILKLRKKGGIHYSKHFEEDSFVFSENEICSLEISDHNIYSVCWLLLSKSAPWPMMEGGLLHNTPKNVLDQYPELFDNIEKCVYSEEHTDRFNLSNKILEDLKNIISTKV